MNSWQESQGNNDKKLADELIGDTKLFTIQGGHHNDLINYDAYHQAIQSILE